jgi:hypothetical protein
VPKSAQAGAIARLYLHFALMPASFILFSCAAIGIALWTLVRRCFRKVKIDYSPSHLQRLHHRAVWLELRLDKARQERWDRTTIVSLSDELGATCEELARAQSGSYRTSTVSVQ